MREAEAHIELDVDRYHEVCRALEWLNYQRDIATAGIGFRATLGAARASIRSLGVELQRLVSAGRSYQAQLERNSRLATQLVAIDAKATSIIEEALSLPPGDEARLAQCFAAIDLLMVRWERYKMERMAPLGSTAVELRSHEKERERERVLAGLGRRKGGALVLLGRILDKRIAMTPWLRVADRYVVLVDGSPQLWIRVHEDEKKYRSMTFRIELVEQATYHDGASDLRIVASANIPFGTFGDTAEYPMAESRAFKREGWITVDVTSNSYNAGSTVSIGQQTGISEQRTVGTSVSETHQEAVSQARTWSQSESQQIGRTITEGENIADTEGTSFGRSWDRTTQMDGSGFFRLWPDSTSRRGGESDTTSTSKTYSRLRSKAVSQTRSATISAGGSEGTTTSTGGSETWNQATSEGRQFSETFQVSRTNGVAVQIDRIHVGIDFTQDPEEKILPQWRLKYPDAYRVFGELWSFINRVDSYLLEARHDAVALPELDLAQTLAELSQYFPIDRGNDVQAFGVLR